MCRHVCPAAKKKVLQKFWLWTKRHTIIIKLIKLNKFKPSFANLKIAYERRGIIKEKKAREKKIERIKKGEKCFGERKVKERE